jgi:CrcB protein
MRAIVAWVALGSAAGGVCRFLIGMAIQQRIDTTFPLGTLVINVTGSLLVGFLVRIAAGAPGLSVENRALLITGFCGGYTTFSAYSLETATLIEDAAYGRAALYIGGSSGLALLGTFAGFALASVVLAAVRGE